MCKSFMTQAVANPLRGLSMENRESHFITDMNQLGYIEKKLQKKDWVYIE